MQETLFYVGIVCGVLAGGFLVATIAMFFGFKIPVLWKDLKDLSGTMTQQRIDEIRQQSTDAAIHKGKVNVFEELEKKAKVKKNNTYSLNISTTTSGLSQGLTTSGVLGNAEQGTSLLQVNKKTIHPDFVIEKDIMFVSTNEVI